MVSKKEKQVKVKVLLPIARVRGLSLRKGDVVTVPESKAEAYFKKGTAIPHTEVDLRDAIIAVRAAGCEIKAAPENKAVANIIAKLDKAEQKEAARKAKEEDSNGSDS